MVKYSAHSLSLPKHNPLALAPPGSNKIGCNVGGIHLAGTQFHRRVQGYRGPATAGDRWAWCLLTLPAVVLLHSFIIRLFCHKCRVSGKHVNQQWELNWHKGIHEREHKQGEVKRCGKEKSGIANLIYMQSYVQTNNTFCPLSM